jgi:CheY-like chemotaxis protein
MNSPVATSCRHTLLVISSDRANMQLVTHLIANRNDLKLLAAPSGNEGMKLAGTAQPKVIVMDTELSDACAKEVLKGLKENPLTSHIPVIAVSADAYPAQIQSGLQDGFYRYLTKPYKLTDLMDGIDSSLKYSLGSGLAM